MLTDLGERTGIEDFSNRMKLLADRAMREQIQTSPDREVVPPA
jgi:hypothetical protein